MLIPANTELTPWPDGQPEYGGAKLAKWETLTAEEKRLFARRPEFVAAYVAYTDYETGRVIQAVKDLGKLDNTLIIFISGDNGTSAEGSLVGTPFDQAALEAVARRRAICSALCPSAHSFLSSATFFASQLMGDTIADRQPQAILVIVRLAHDRRFVRGVVLFVVVVCLHLHPDLGAASYCG